MGIRNLTIALVALAMPVAHAGDLAVNRTALLTMLRTNVFSENGHHELTTHQECSYAFLEQPDVHLVGGRVMISAHLSSRTGAKVGGACIGPGDAIDIRVSARPVAHGGELGLEDLRVEDPAEGPYHILLEGALAGLQQQLHVNILEELQKVLPTSPYNVTLSKVVLASVTVTDETLHIAFDIRGTIQ